MLICKVRCVYRLYVVDCCVLIKFERYNLRFVSPRYSYMIRNFHTGIDEINETVATNILW